MAYIAHIFSCKWGSNSSWSRTSIQTRNN